MSSVRVCVTLGVLGLFVMSGSVGLIGRLRHSVTAQGQAGQNAPAAGELDQSRSEVRGAIERYQADRGSLSRSYPVESSPARMARFRQFYGDWLSLLGKMNFDSFSQEGKVDYVLFRNHLEHEQQQLDLMSRGLAEIAALVPFSQKITELAEARRRMEPIDSPKVAALLNQLNKEIETTRRAVETGLRAEPGKLKKTVANRGAQAVASLRGTLRTWFAYYNGYDPLFTWWNQLPYKKLDDAMKDYSTFLREKVAGVAADDKTTV
ncbi:MAG: hypothetical protein SF339_18925, partial [Blastocatellia bacterium]|nr:hypothetical protein [Blastocatellia bacterium]